MEYRGNRYEALLFPMGDNEQRKAAARRLLRACLRYRRLCDTRRLAAAGNLKRLLLSRIVLGLCTLRGPCERSGGGLGFETA